MRIALLIAGLSITAGLLPCQPAVQTYPRSSKAPTQLRVFVGRPLAAALSDEFACPRTRIVRRTAPPAVLPFLGRRSWRDVLPTLT